MKLYDVSVSIVKGMPVWPTDPGVSIKLASSLAKGDSANVTRIEMGAHTGTHMDAPRHFERRGKGIDSLPLDVLIGRCRVLDFRKCRGHITRAMLERCDLKGVKRVLFKTTNSSLWKREKHKFNTDFVALAADGAEYLVLRGVKLVGVDYLSVEPFGSKEHPVHHTLLRAKVVVIEGLNLSRVRAGDYDLMALPLKLKGADGAPARVVLRAP
jgi:arylformamidase